ncbi:hypothetical protein GT037_001578 [Alternaria burnsii]|uniref:Heterokaryon incompatibility domain-containing protein n=1 Tax=Alternaria burnsii TaxID=1187904 RepID=A0A8H7BDP3_9PLEO|nr:uncharacterized protein GT037_001578 [Alternaria burnsii]KAF7679927.1 hypothetical protein GT037_001578 [Alternaria burnsii]
MAVTRSQTRRSITTTHTFHEQFPLPSDEKSIRVLCIQPGVRGTTIEASLSKIDLNDPKRPPYTALSYTWGDAAIVDYVHVNDEKIGVGANLFHALQDIRSPDESIVIWVDAICIDQMDNIEKSHQVSHMDLVYKLCEQVYIWLGSPGDSDLVRSNPFALVEHFAADKHFYELPGYHKKQGTDTWKLDTNNADFISIWKGFGLLAESSWWHRAWTVQEVILPNQAVVIYEASRRVARGFKTFSDVSFAYINRQCSNPLDKIYCLLGLSGSSKIELYPDYTKEVSEVYVEAFCKLLEEADMSPRCLLGQGFNSERFNLPSWVRDFSAVFDPISQIRRAHEDYHLFKACGGLSEKLEVKDRKRLLTHGLLIDRVKAMAIETYIWGSHKLAEALQSGRRTCDENGVPVRTDGAVDAFARVLCGGVIHRGPGRSELLEENDVDLPTDSEWSEFWATGKAYKSLPRRYRTACVNALDRRIFYVTSSGRIGLSFPNTKVGDEVWVIHGSNVPFILRRQSESPVQHRLVGETYLQA